VAYHFDNPHEVRDQAASFSGGDCSTRDAQIKDRASLDSTPGGAVAICRVRAPESGERAR